MVAMIEDSTRVQHHRCGWDCLCQQECDQAPHHPSKTSRLVEKINERYLSLATFPIELPTVGQCSTVCPHEAVNAIQSINFGLIPMKSPTRGTCQTPCFLQPVFVLRESHHRFAQLTSSECRVGSRQSSHLLYFSHHIWSLINSLGRLFCTYT